MSVSAAQINTLTQNVTSAFFSSTLNPPRISPTDGLNDGGFRDDTITIGPYWQMAQMLRFLTERALAFSSDSATAAQVREQASFLTGYYSEADLESNGSTDGTINVSDDGAWKMLSFCDLHALTGDGAWLTRVQNALPKVLALYLDPNTNNPTQTDSYGEGLSWNTYGLRYALPSENAQQNVSTTYEAGLAIAALYVYRQTGKMGYIQYARAMARSFMANFKDQLRSGIDPGDNPGAYWLQLNLAPYTESSGAVEAAYTPNNRTYEPINSDGKRHPLRGQSSHSLGQTIAVGVLCARLYFIDGTSEWLNEVVSIANALANTSIYTMVDNTLLSDRDAYTQAFFAPEFVRTALSLGAVGVDPSGAVRNSIISSASYILNSGSEALYGESYTGYIADWGVPAANRNGTLGGGQATWKAEGESNGVPTGSPASAKQMMTTANSALMALAGYVASITTGDQLTDSGDNLTDNNAYLVDA